ncbi:hypothetical protein EDC96DRAFT_517343 [Choanephora cucurbitarum]|nr:hypothetical protein EDC96DRAFT_517343 [Choanephora cucurbitarum]
MVAASSIWMIQHPKKTKKELLKTVNELNLKPVYTTYEIAAKYNHKIQITPRYHYELQLIEKVWSMVKNLIAFDPDLDGTLESLKTKLETSLKTIDQESLKSFWRSTTDTARRYSKEFDDSCALLEQVEDKDD